MRCSNHGSRGKHGGGSRVRSTCLDGRLHVSDLACQHDDALAPHAARDAQIEDRDPRRLDGDIRRLDRACSRVGLDQPERALALALRGAEERRDDLPVNATEESIT